MPSRVRDASAEAEAVQLAAVRARFPEKSTVALAFLVCETGPGDTR